MNNDEKVRRIQEIALMADTGLNTPYISLYQRLKGLLGFDFRAKSPNPLDVARNAVDFAKEVIRLSELEGNE